MLYRHCKVPAAFYWFQDVISFSGALLRLERLWGGLLKLYMRQMQINIIFRGRIVNPKLSRPAADLLWHLNDVLSFDWKGSSFPQLSNLFSSLVHSLQIKLFCKFSVKSATKSSFLTKKWACTKHVHYIRRGTRQYWLHQVQIQNVMLDRVKWESFVVIYCTVLSLPNHRSRFPTFYFNQEKTMISSKCREVTKSQQRYKNR